MNSELYGCSECAKFWTNASSRNVEGCMHNLTHRNMAAAGLRSIAATRDWARFLKCVKKARAICAHTSATDRLWALAMTLCYGPVGLHESRRGADGRPTAETLAMPSVADAMRRAEEDIASALWRFEMDCVLGFATWAGLASDAAFPLLYGKAA